MKLQILPALLAIALATPAAACAHHRTNPPGPAGGPGASAAYYKPVFIRGTRVRLTARSGGYYYHPRYGYWHANYGWWNQAARCWYDRDDNPPGRAGGPGTNWENPPGLRGGPGASPDRFGRCR